MFKIKLLLAFWVAFPSCLVRLSPIQGILFLKVVPAVLDEGYYLPDTLSWPLTHKKQL